MKIIKKLINFIILFIILAGLLYISYRMLFWINGKELRQTLQEKDKIIQQRYVTNY